MVPATEVRLLLNGILLVAIVVAGVAGLIALRRHWLGGDGLTGFGGSGGIGREDWEETLVGYKNLRDEGVLSEDEFRKLRTLVEPLLRTGIPELRGRQWPPQDPVGPEEARE